MHGHWTSIDTVENFKYVSFVLNYTRIVKLLLHKEKYHNLMKSQTLLASVPIGHWSKANSRHVPVLATMFFLYIDTMTQQFTGEK